MPSYHFRIGSWAGAGIGLSLLLLLVPAAVLAYRQRQASRKRTDDKAGLIDLTDDVTQEDIMQKMPMDIVVKVAKEGRQEEITFHTWDFGGQEVYYVLHHLFITVRGVACVWHSLHRSSIRLHISQPPGGRLLPLLRHARGQEQHRRVAAVPRLLA